MPLPAGQAWSGDDRELIERARSGPDGFVELYDRFFQTVYNFVFYRTRNHAIAEDVVSETFFAALKALPRYEWRGRPVRSWLFRIAANEIATYYRKHRDVLLAVAPGGDGGEAGTARDVADLGASQPWESSDPLTPEVQAERQADYRTALTALSGLPDDQQEAIVLRYINDLDIDEIAAILDRTDGAVRALISRGLKGLRSRLAAEGGLA